jgi:N-terminal acetyltransferase B complex non-catalytic subunit
LKTNKQITELLDAYRDSKIGTASRITKGEWVFKRSQVILLEAAEQWQELFDISHCLLEEAHAGASGKIKDERGADWTVWKAYINAAVHLQTQE